MSAADAAALAVLLRQAQWAIDDAAHRVPEDRFDGDEHRDLADALEALAGMLRARADRCMVLDQPSR
ncbi:hypothetical protein LCD36_05500 [Saccharopolyspora sp. 6T]|uniref:hypothetical protein n=1 Tax=Saccharopolyspora sp. 6T TaxID=2877238 RepID=UPI001CD5CA1D|nr:hypothetical protein [Saccharopolyspora sp. 6T]MCA1185904.1 hypothetical protein [Saccharopolyspora sp. 6T]